MRAIYPLAALALILTSFMVKLLFGGQYVTNTLEILKRMIQKEGASDTMLRYVDSSSRIITSQLNTLTGWLVVLSVLSAISLCMNYILSGKVRDHKKEIQAMKAEQSEDIN